MLEVCLLGTSGMMPLPGRFLASCLTRYNGFGLLIDCGEGTQVALRKRGFSCHDIDMILITHTHGDHVSGLPGMLLTMGNGGRCEPVTITGPKGVENPNDYEAMSEIMWCGSVSHVGLTGVGAKGDTPREGDWSCHQLGMAISALYDSTHGATLTAVWAAWSRYVLDTNPARFARFARKVYGITEVDDRKAAEEGILRTNAFFRSLGMPLSLTELLGHTPDDAEIEKIAIECTYDRTRKIGSFMVLDYDDIIAIYQNCR